MKLHLANTQGIKLFTAYGDDYVAVNHEKHQKNLILLPDALNEAWTEANVGTLTEADMAKLLTLGTEIVLLGTGKRLRKKSFYYYKKLIASNGADLENDVTIPEE